MTTDIDEQCFKGKEFYHILNAQRLDIQHGHGNPAKGLTLYLHFSSVSARDIELSMVFQVASQTCSLLIKKETGDISLDYIFSDDSLLIPSEFQVTLYLSKTTAACEVTGALITRGA